MKLTAAAALSFVRTHKAKSSWEGDVVCFEWRNRKLRVNSVTGQLVGQVSEKRGLAQADADTGQVAEQVAGEDADADSEHSWPPDITLERGRFERQLAEIEKTSADWPNAADERRPLSCMGEFICEELQRFDAKSKRGYAVLGKLLARGLLQPFDELVCQTCRPAADGFMIPHPYFHYNFNSVNELLALGPVFARAFGIRLGNNLFSDEGWMNALWRNGLLVLADGRQEAKDDLSCLPAGDGGAICALAAAEVLRAAGAAHLSPVCAGRGLRRLSPAAFRDDCRDLLCGRGFLSKCVLQTAAAMRQLDADEIKALAELLTRCEALGTAQAAIFEQSASALRTNRDDSPAQAAGRALDVLWRTGLSAWVEQRLQALASPPAPAEAPYTHAVPNTFPPHGGFGPPPAVPVPTPATVRGPASPFGLPHYRPGSISTPAEEHIHAAPPEQAKSLKHEVRELKWLARAVTDRLEKLEERLQSEGGEAINGVGGLRLPSASERYVEHGKASSDAKVTPLSAEAPPDQQTQILFFGPEGMTVHWDVTAPGKFDSEPLTVPGRYNFPRAAAYRLKLSQIPGHDGAELYPHLEIAPAVPRSEDFLKHNAISLELSEEEIEHILAGKPFTKVMCLPDRDGEADSLPGVIALTSIGLGAGVDPIVEADRLGVILAILQAGVAPPQSGGGPISSAMRTPRVSTPTDRGVQAAEQKNEKE
ncbi:MAG TPA: hypothetical protein VNH11_15315 [Pirellulales bacterium]|nr:hypothetical protein [Pirellulales bacterium]